jgi:hypothetical protein
LYKSGGKRDDCFPSGDKFEMLDERRGNIGSIEHERSSFSLPRFASSSKILFSESVLVFSLIVAISHVEIKKRRMFHIFF